ncbi:D-amino-acid oxidase [Microthyrium microscopicum]|uniref:D-amino-acid oxidase n=1 Tax=Microthyrium microscopicum TaxID=703497 RepID=A0A6A6U199_9PEZI|nr:D-amino-acid oxidase [Microthyrium microscopicum]
MAHKNIVVVGAGVAGLTTALLLSRDERYSITVAAKHMPGDYDIEYASPWAGADYLPVSVRGTDAAQWDRRTWEYLQDLAENHLDAGVHFQKLILLLACKQQIRQKDWEAREKPSLPDIWWKDMLPDFKDTTNSELELGFASCSFTSVCINTAIYLPWLLSQCLKAGVHLKRAVFTHISDAAAPCVHHSGQQADLLIHCTGLSARNLGGIEDNTLFPIRGQLVIVRNSPGGNYSIVDGQRQSDEVTYMMTRAAGGGTILGGCTQKNNWDSQPDPTRRLALRIMKRCIDVCPDLTDGKGIENLDIIRHAVGLRPARENGARVEKEKIGDIWVVHNYGHGGAGYQSSYGCAEAAVALVNEVL